jgi:phosphoserine phosphatase RsbU/P
MDRLLWAFLAVAGLVAASIWLRSARYRARRVRHLDDDSGDGDLRYLARAGVRRDLHAASLYLVLALAGVVGVWAPGGPWPAVALALVAVPVGVTLVFGRRLVADARLELSRSDLERRAQEVLVQDALAPRRWAARLAPDHLPEIAGLDIGGVHQAGAGVMAGDFYDVVQVGPGRVAVVIGDVAGHGIEPAITAFQTKYLLRVFLRRYRDPAQALEELNRQLGSETRPEEFVSVWVGIVDGVVGSLRYASAGHPPAWLWHDRDLEELSSTGPLLLLDPAGDFRARELAMDSGDLLLVHTDGLSEARNGDQVFGEDRIAATLRRDPGVAPDVLCKALLDAATDFASGPINDDLAILALRRT